MAATADQSPSAGYQHARTGVQVATALNLAESAVQPGDLGTAAAHSAEAVTFPVVDWSAEAIAEHEAQALATQREQMVCSPAQGRLALLNAGLLDSVESWVATQSRAVQIEYASRTEWRRTWPLVISAGTTLGLTDTDLDNLFAAAGAL